MTTEKKLYKEILFSCFLLIGISILSSSCQKKLSFEDEFIKSRYYKENSLILRTEMTYCDLTADVYVTMPPNSQVFPQIKLFNYGEDIRLSDALIENIFVYNIGKIKLLSLLSEIPNIDIKDIRNNETYGNWAYATVSSDNFFIDNIFVSPIAYNDYEKGDISNLVLVVIESDEKYLSVIYKADSIVLCLLASSIPIYNDEKFWHCHDRGVFWKLK